MMMSYEFFVYILQVGIVFIGICVVFKYYFFNFFIYKMFNWFCFVVLYCLGKVFYKKFCSDNLENFLEIGSLFEK